MLQNKAFFLATYYYYGNSERRLIRIFTYGFSIKGTRHIETGKPCQDAHKIVKLYNDWVVAAVADGLGSANYSDVSANIAVKALTKTVESAIHREWNAQSIMAILHTGFIVAQKEIEEEIEKQSRLPEEYDTTLTAVVYNGRKIVYGHVGDGGIIGLGSFGDFVKVTEVQKGEEHNMVVPLRGGPDYWVFDYSEEEFCSILLLTDGLLDIMLPSLLQGDIYINYVRQFMDMNKLSLTKDNQGQVSKKIEEYLKSDNLDFVTDDKTMVGLINLEIVPQEKESSYYEEPDWNKLKNNLKLALYKDTEIALNENEPSAKSTDVNGESSSQKKPETAALDKIDEITDFNGKKTEDLHKGPADNVDRNDSNSANKNENEKTERPKTQTEPKGRNNNFFSNLFKKIINK